LRSYFTDYLYQWGGYDFGRFFTGALGLLLIKYWTPVINEMWESEETGDLTEVEVWLNEQPEQFQQDSARLDQEADTLYQNMNDKEIEEANRILDSLQTILNTSSGIEIVPIPSRNQ
jgi:hypothetical protein